MTSHQSFITKVTNWSATSSPTPGNSSTQDHHHTFLLAVIIMLITSLILWVLYHIIRLTYNHVNEKSTKHQGNRILSLEEEQQRRAEMNEAILKTFRERQSRPYSGGYRYDEMRITGPVELPNTEARDISKASGILLGRSDDLAEHPTLWLP